MKIAILGAGAMGSLYGGYLAKAGQDVTMIDVVPAVVDTLNNDGLRIEEKSGETDTYPLKATMDPVKVGLVDLLLVFVKCYHTEDAIRRAAPMIGENTTVLTLQNGWGNAPRIADIIGEKHVMVGLTYHSATVLGPGHIKHAGAGMTILGEFDKKISDRENAVAVAFRSASFEVTESSEIMDQIWSKLALNVCTLPTSSLLRFTAEKLIEHEGVMDLMRGLLKETIAVARAQDIPLDEEERWAGITGLLKQAIGARASMLQDVENQRRTEIDVINGAIVEAGKRHGIPTPLNDSMVWLIKSLEEGYLKA